MGVKIHLGKGMIKPETIEKLNKRKCCVRSHSSCDSAVKEQDHETECGGIFGRRHGGAVSFGGRRNTADYCGCAWRNCF